MTFNELLISLSSGHFPRVNSSIKHRHAESSSGVVTTIKDSHGYRGCAVRFDGMTYDTWFYDDPGTDKRMRYMDQLTIEK